LTFTTPISTQSLADQAFDKLVSAIVRGKLGRSEGLKSGTEYHQDPSDEDFHFRNVRGSGNQRLI
jgi:hypothetical protein